MTTRYFPEKFNIVTSADEVGMLADVERITGESLLSYKKRILESSTKVTNSSYSGLLNAINRELGLSQKEIIQVNLRKLVTGNLEDPAITRTSLAISDSRYYEGIVDGANTTIMGNILTSHIHLWPVDYLVGLTLELEGIEYLITSNTPNKISLNKTPSSLGIGHTYTIRTKWIRNSFIGYALVLDKVNYEIIANDENTLTLNKTIKYQLDSTYYIRLNRPRIKITSSRIIFYKGFLNDNNYQLDLIVDLRENSLTHRDLVKLVNEQSSFFQLVDLIPYEDECSGFTIKEKDSTIPIYREFIPSSKFFKLENKNLVPGTIKFSEINVFAIEEEELDPELFGPYYSINEESGTVQSKMLTNGQGEVSYSYMDFPFKIEQTPAVVTSLFDPESNQFLFSQQEKILYDDPRDRFVSSQPKIDMIEYIAELLRISKQSWGS